MQAGKQQKERGNSTERKGSNEPIMPVEELIATALSSESVPEAAKQLSAGPGSAGDRMGSLQAISRGVHCQTSAQDLENQRQNMVAAQEQVRSLSSQTLHPVCHLLALYGNAAFPSW